MNADDLRGRFLSAAGVAGTGSECPPPERIWDAVRDEHASTAFGEVLDHVALCPACALAWRLARDYGAEEMKADATAVSRASSRRRWGVPAAAAAALILVSLTVWSFLPDRPPGSTLRMPDESIMRSLVPEQTPLPRSEVWLRWTPAGAEVTRYTVRVLDEDLKLLQSATELERPEYRVPESAFEGLAPGARVLWQVDASLPDGHRQTSGTFVIRIE